MEERIAKLRSHTDHLIDGVLGLAMNSALLAPLIRDSGMAVHMRKGERAAGFLALRHTLFMSCALDIAKFAYDEDKRSPSLAKLMTALKADPTLVARLREDFAAYKLHPRPGGVASPAELAAISARITDERRMLFDRFLAEAAAEWDVFQSQRYAEGFHTLRDKYIAHLELRPNESGGYAPLALDSLGLQWDDIGDAVTRIAALAKTLSTLIRNADFSMDAALDMYKESGNAFWR